MAQKKQTIVIKKIIVQGGGHHGGSWKVALADFMTALMAFFLVMWLVGQSEETKKAVSDYFSTPSVIEYNYQNFGAEVTLEKLFLDLVNEPLRAFQSFLEPADKTPNILDMGSAKVVSAFMADKMNDVAKNVTIAQNGFDFDIPDTYLFERGTAQPNAQFIEVMNRLTQITSGLQDADVTVTSMLFTQAVADKTQATAEKVARDRLNTVSSKIHASFEHGNNGLKGSISVKDKKGEVDVQKLIGIIRISIRQKPSEKLENRRKIQSIFGEKESAQNNYDGESVPRRGTASARGGRSDEEIFVNPVDMEVQKIQNAADPLSRPQYEE